jgi:hypothetical protein
MNFVNRIEVVQGVKPSCIKIGKKGKVLTFNG